MGEVVRTRVTYERHREIDRIKSIDFSFIFFLIN